MILWLILNARIHSGDIMVTLDRWSVYSLSRWVHTLDQVELDSQQGCVCTHENTWLHKVSWDPLQWRWHDPYAGNGSKHIPLFQFTTRLGRHILAAQTAWVLEIGRQRMYVCNSVFTIMCANRQQMYWLKQENRIVLDNSKERREREEKKRDTNTNLYY